MSAIRMIEVIESAATTVADNAEVVIDTGAEMVKSGNGLRYVAIGAAVIGVAGVAYGVGKLAGWGLAKIVMKGAAKGVEAAEATATAEPSAAPLADNA